MTGKVTTSGGTILKSYGIESPRGWYRKSIWVVVAAALLSSLIFLILNLEKIAEIKFTDVITPTVALGAFVIGYMQWRFARHEASLEKFYDRLDFANRRLAQIVEVAADDKNPYEAPKYTSISPFDLWVFAELDNLEYVLEKYRLGWMSDVHACRGLRTFQARCKHDPEFMERARRFTQAAGYQRTTEKVVSKIYDEERRVHKSRNTAPTS